MGHIPSIEPNKIGNFKILLQFLWFFREMKSFTTSIVYSCQKKDNFIHLLCSICWTAKLDKNWFFYAESFCCWSRLWTQMWGIFRQMIRSIYVNMKVFPDHKNGTLFSAAKVHCMQCYALSVYTYIINGGKLGLAKAFSCSIHTVLCSSFPYARLPLSAVKGTITQKGKYCIWF